MLSTTFRYFHEVARTGSIRKAAQNLNISASAISRQVTLLEYELGQPLIERLARGVQLTRAGDVVSKHLHESLVSEDLMRARLAELNRTETGRVSIAAVEGALSHVLPSAIRRYAAEFEVLDITINIAGADTAAQSVRDDDTEIGVVFQPDDLKRLDVVIAVATPFCAILPRAHPLADMASLRFRDVAHLPLILNDHGFSARVHIDRAARDAGLEIKSSVTVNSLDGAKALVAAGLGVAFMPGFGAANEIEAGRLAAVPLVDKALCGASLMVIVRDGRTLSRSASVMLRTLKDTVKPLT
jgi:DNA-binding transcriptional LysR family regulator